MIYFVQAASGPIKIGFTGDWSKRLRQLQSGSPERLTLLLVVAGTPSDERALHRKFSAHRLRGEWFDPAPEILAHVDSRLGDAVALRMPKSRASGTVVTIQDFLERIKPRQLVYDLLGINAQRAHEILRGAPMCTRMMARIHRRALTPIFGADRARDILAASLDAWSKSPEWKSHDAEVSPELLARVLAIFAPAVDHTTSSAAA